MYVRIYRRYFMGFLRYWCREKCEKVDVFGKDFGKVLKEIDF